MHSYCCAEKGLYIISTSMMYHDEEGTQGTTSDTVHTVSSRFQRQRNQRTQSTRVWTCFMAWTILIQQIQAFSIRTSPSKRGYDVPLPNTGQTYYTLQRHMAPAYIQLFTENDNDDSSLEDSDDPESSRWLRWMTGGTPRGVAEVKMRDPPALGGVARSDRYAARDWLHNALSLPTSRILKSISFPVFSMTFWGMAISLLHKYLEMNGKQEIAAKLCIPIQPHSLMVSALGLLLVFRTNSAYQRFAEGRKIWEDILSIARDLSRLSKLYEPQIGTLKLRRVNRLLAAFPYLLRFRIKPNSIMRKLDDKTVERDPETSLILYQDHGTYTLTCINTCMHT
jgi:hypothetical protein